VGGATVDEVWKDGSTAGFNSFIAYALARGTGVFVLANWDVPPDTQTLAEAVLTHLP
jgi:hypothetical protein